jgi:hypothetical protein
MIPSASTVSDTLFPVCFHDEMLPTLRCDAAIRRGGQPHRVLSSPTHEQPIVMYSCLAAMALSPGRFAACRCCATIHGGSPRPVLRLHVT